jgi:ribonuclease P protein subunit POP4
VQKKAKTERLVLIGSIIQIEGSKNKTLNGINGKIIDETKNTITIQTTKGTKKIIKDQTTIRVNNKTIDGKKLIGRTESRIKQ